MVPLHFHITQWGFSFSPQILGRRNLHNKQLQCAQALWCAAADTFLLAYQEHGDKRPPTPLCTWESCLPSLQQGA